MSIETASASDERPASLLRLLEEMRRIAQLGLNYTTDPYDRERYLRLLELASGQYSELTGLPVGDIMDRFRAELGHITPKVGVDAAILDDQGRLLLVRRADDNLWCLPCGWAELAESPQQSLAREILEETGLEAEVRELLDVFYRLPGEYGPHTSFHLLYHCVPVGGELRPSPETVEVRYMDHRTVTTWHKDHAVRAARAHDFWLRARQAAVSPGDTHVF